MSDPFDVLRGTHSPVVPDASFADAVMGAVRTRLDVAAERPPVDAETDRRARARRSPEPTELEVVPVSTRLSKPRWSYVAAVVALLAAAVVAVLLTRGGSSTDPSTDTTVATTSTTETIRPAIAVPAPLQARWMGEHPAVETSDVGASLSFTADTFTVTQSNTVTQAIFRGTATRSGADELVLTGDGSGSYCKDGQPGTYRWELSPSARTLTMSAVADTCGERAAAVEGVFRLTRCVEPGTFCLGEIDAGLHVSQYMAPLLPTGAPWIPVVGGVSYEVPDGWANWWDWGDRFGVSLASDYANTTPENVEPAKSVYVASSGNGATDDIACGAGVPDLDGSTVADTFAAMAALPGLVVSDPTPITLGGLQGSWVDLSVDPASLEPCEGEEVVVYLHPNDHLTQGLAPGQRHRVILLQQENNSSGPLVAITIAVSDEADFADWVVQAMPVVESMRFSSRATSSPG